MRCGNVLESVFLSMTQDDLFDVIAELTNADLDSNLYTGDLKTFARQIIDDMPFKITEILYGADAIWYSGCLEDVLEEISLATPKLEVADIVDNFFCLMINDDDNMVIYNGTRKAILNADFITARITAYRNVVIRTIMKI